jgi:tetratricopeptide (TPR) repeat protein
MFVLPRLGKIFDSISFAILVVSIIILPLLIDTSSSQIFTLSKQTTLVLVTGILLLVMAGKLVVEKQLFVRLSIFDKIALLLAVVGWLSGFFGIAMSTSLLGRSDYFVLNAVLLSTLVIFAWLTIQNFTTVERWRTALDALLVCGGATAFVFLLRALFHFDLLGKIAPGIWSTIDVTNINFGLWLLMIFLLSAGQLIKRDVASGRLLLFFFVAAECFLSLAVLGFSVLWWPLAAGLILLLIAGVSFLRSARRGWLITLFILLITTTVFIIFGAPQSLQTAVPSEVSLSLQPSWVIVSHGLFSGAKNFLLGTGPGSFAVTFSEYRDATFNYDQAAAGLRFNYPFSTALALLAEHGVLFSLSFIFLFVFILGYVLFGWRRARIVEQVEDRQSANFFIEEENLNATAILETLFVCIPWIILSGSLFLVFITTTLWWLWWLLLAMTIAGLALANPDLVRMRELVLQETPEQSLSFSFVLIIIVSVLIIFGIWDGRLYIADRAYAKAIHATDTATAEKNLLNAIRYRDNYDLYHVALAQVYLNEAVQASQGSKPDMQAVSNLVGQAVNEARRATAIAPHSVLLWENLATMYENAALLVPEASDWAIKALQSALELEPSNAFLVSRLGDDYGYKLKKNDWAGAIKQYQIAINLKKDYIDVYIALANAYEQNKEIDKAVSTFGVIVSAAGQNVDVLYNYGRLLYNRNTKGDRDQAEKIWQQALLVNPNHSNTLFSLGLFNELRGNKTKALEYYYKVKDLNPDNKDIVAKIAKLVGR